MTKREATEKWVSGFNAIPHSIFEALWTHAGNSVGDGWNEVTKPCVGDRIGFTPEAVAAIFPGEVTGIDGQDLYQITLDEHIEQLDYSGNVFYVPEDAIYVERDSQLPKCETMWSFDDSRDIDWLRESGSLQRMSECGFRIYQHEEFGYFFGVDGSDHNLYERHWAPLYEARGLKLHDKEMETSTPSYMLQAYIENPDRPHDGGFTIPLPTTEEVIAPFVESLGITDIHNVSVGEVYSTHDGDNNLSHWLDKALRDAGGLHSLEGLNYHKAVLLRFITP